MFVVVIVAGAMAYAVVAAMVAIIVWLLTSFIGLIFLGLFVLMVIVEMIAPSNLEEDDTEGGDPRE